jgi:transcriptional regulator
MYIPRHYQAQDQQATHAFMRQFSFASLVSSEQGGRPLATHLPFLVQEQGEGLLLRAHLARANPQVEHLKTPAQVLVVFQEPHAYVSPRHYEKELNVPTWNYVAVHAYGTPVVLDDPERVRQLMEDSIAAFEPAYLKQWKSLPETYTSKMLQGITAFELPVEELHAKEKLSQNKTEAEQARIRESFLQSGDPSQEWIGRRMKDRAK